jgi:hypothetical protein
MCPSRRILAAIATALIAVTPVLAFQFPLSETASRAAYFLGQRHDNSLAEFLARYSKHLPPPKSGPYVSDIVFFTPFAQLVQHSSHQGIYSAQQAEAEGPKNFGSVEIAVYISFPHPSSFPTYAIRPASMDTGHNPIESWTSYAVRVFDGKELRQPSSVFGQSQNLCSQRGGCIRVGTVIRLTVPAELFSSDTATIEVTTPDGQVINVDFDLVSLR